MYVVAENTRYIYIIIYNTCTTRLQGQFVYIYFIIILYLWFIHYIFHV